jgi:BlaI family penicillinase repressor
VQDGPRYVFLPVVPRDRARKSAMKNLVRTFFDGSAAQAAAALIDQSKLSDEEFDRLAALIDKARKDGR